MSDCQNLFESYMEHRVSALRESVENGYFKCVLVGMGAVGAGLVYHGTSAGNDLTTGMGTGILILDAIYALGCYGVDLINKI